MSRLGVISLDRLGRKREGKGRGMRWNGEQGECWRWADGKGVRERVLESGMDCMFRIVSGTGFWFCCHTSEE